MYNPLVSIVIPVYNGSNYLAEAIDSALAQTYENIEILVINDGSNDNGATERIALSYGDKIRYFRKDNGGVSSALNLGIENMSGEWFSWLSHDDLYTSDKIEKQILRINEELDNNQVNLNRTIIIADTQYVDKMARPIFRYQKHLRNRHYNGSQMLLEVFSGYYISGCTLLIKKSIFESAGLFNTELKYMQDMEMWYRIMLSDCNFYYVDAKIVLSRVHQKQLTVTGKSLGTKDAAIVGTWMSTQLIDRYENGKYLLLQYYYLAILRQAHITADLLKKELIKENKYSFMVVFKSEAIKLYAGLRPFLVSVYYKLIANIKVQYK